MSSTGGIPCLCGAINIPLTTSLPGLTDLCHCTVCRYTTGALFAGWCDLPEPPEPDVLAKCLVYSSSKMYNRYFCSTCGTKAFIHCLQQADGSPRDKWLAYGGAIDPPSPTVENILNIEGHDFVEGTIDGGMAAFMRDLDGRSVPCFSDGAGSTEISSTDLDRMMTDASHQSAPVAGETLRTECQCGGVSLRIQPADHSNRSISQLDRFIAKDKAGHPTGKHMAFCCVCRYCRLGTGVSLTPFAYIPPMQVLNAHTNKPVTQPCETQGPADGEENKGLSLRHFWSSDSACRSFCEVCGASVFYSTKKRKEILNVHAGLLRAEDGALARRWLSWQWGRTAWKDETTQKDITDAWRATANQ